MYNNGNNNDKNNDNNICYINKNNNISNDDRINNSNDNHNNYSNYGNNYSNNNNNMITKNQFIFCTMESGVPKVSAKKATEQVPFELKSVHRVRASSFIAPTDADITALVTFKARPMPIYQDAVC